MGGDGERKPGRDRGEKEREGREGGRERGGEGVSEKGREERDSGYREPLADVKSLLVDEVAEDRDEDHVGTYDGREGALKVGMYWLHPAHHHYDECCLSIVL